MTIEAADDGETCLPYREQMRPQLQPGAIVVMDNLSAQKVCGVRDFVQQTEPSYGNCRLTLRT